METKIDMNIINTMEIKEIVHRLRQHKEIHHRKEQNSPIITNILEWCAEILEDIDKGKIGYIKMGKWIHHQNYRDIDGDIRAIFKCSNCGQLSEDYNYCPYCGANMQTKEKE